MSKSKRLCVVELTYKVRVTMPEDEFSDPVTGAKFAVKDLVEQRIVPEKIAIRMNVIDEKMLGYEGTEDT